jgi:hypothetical protein
MNASVSQSIVSVPFHDDVLDAVQADDGKIFVSIRRVCESLVIDTQGQLAKLKSRSWATIEMISTVAEDGKRRELAMIDHESLPIWMTHINPLKVAPSVREKIDRFQREAKAVLAAWFLGTSADRPDIAAELKGLREKLAENERAMARVENRLGWVTEFRDQYRLRNAELEIKADYFEARAATLGNCDPDAYWTFWDFCQEFGVLSRPLKHSEKIRTTKAIAKLSRDLDIEIRKVTGSRFGEINSYRIDVLNLWRAEHDKQNRLDAVAFQRQVDSMSDGWFMRTR